MKFTSIAALACIGMVSAQAEWDDDYDADDDMEYEEKEYDDDEKMKWIYGQPGDPDYKAELSGEEIVMREEMWVLDLGVQKSRGIFQGWHRGFYKDYDWEMGKDCFSRTSVIQMYWLQKIITTFQFNEWVKLQGLFFNLYFMFDHACDIDTNMNDIANFCFHYDCRGEALL
jgi:hypothetical protein